MTRDDNVCRIWCSAVAGASSAGGAACCGMRGLEGKSTNFGDWCFPRLPSPFLLQREGDRGEEFLGASGELQEGLPIVCCVGRAPLCSAGMAPAPALPGWAEGTTSGGCSSCSCEHPLPHLPQLHFMSSLFPLPPFWGKP